MHLLTALAKTIDVLRGRQIKGRRERQQRRLVTQWHGATTAKAQPMSQSDRHDNPDPRTDPAWDPPHNHDDLEVIEVFDVEGVDSVCCIYDPHNDDAWMQSTEAHPTAQRR